MDEEIFEQKLPRFKEMCETMDGADSIVLSSSAFGDDIDELTLLGMAVKYATKRKINMMITHGGDLTIK